MMNKSRRIYLRVVLALLMAGPWSLVPGPSLWAGETKMKMGYVDMGKLFDAYERTRRSESVLERKGQQKEDELQKRLAELRKLQDGLDLLSDRAREGRTREIDRKADELKRFGDYTRNDLVRERNGLAQEIILDIQETVQEYAIANGYALVLDERSLLYGREVDDLTDAVLKKLNARDAKQAKRSR